MKKSLLILSFSIALWSASSFAENLVPNNSSQNSPNIWCTWGSQNSVPKEQAQKIRETVKREIAFAGDQGGGADFARNCINEETVFGENGWAHQWNNFRGDMFLLFDDGWDVPYNTPAKNNGALFGSFCVDEKKFPSFKGTPAQRLKQIDEKIRALGWRGLGLWIAAQSLGETWQKYLPDDYVRNYWRERILWSKEAGVKYWKVDWGARCLNIGFRKMLTEESKKLFPELIIEHTRTMDPFNGYKLGKEITGSGKICDDRPDRLKITNECLKFSDVYRTYDTLGAIGSTTALERAAYCLQVGEAENSPTIINIEDEPHIAVGLAAAMGIMRQDNKYADNVKRTLRWMRIAPAEKIAALKTYISDTRLEDEWFYKKGSVWHSGLWDKTIKQSAPAIITRGIKNPTVTPRGKNVPYVLATLHQSGDLAIAFGNRTAASGTESKSYLPAADVFFDIDCLGRKICLFNVNGDISMRVGQNIKNVKVLAQDLLSDKAMDVSDKVVLKDGILTFPADLSKSISKSEMGEGCNGLVFKVTAQK